MDIYYNDEENRFERAYTLHPTFRIFLRRQLHNLPRYRVFDFKTAYVDYHRWRFVRVAALGSKIVYKVKNIDVTAQPHVTPDLAEKIEAQIRDSALMEVRIGPDTFLSAIDMALETDLRCYFPLIVLHCMTKELGEADHVNIPVETIVAYIERVLNEFLEPAPGGGKTCTVQGLERLATEYHEPAPKEDLVTILRSLSWLAIWLWRFYVNRRTRCTKYWTRSRRAGT